MDDAQQRFRHAQQQLFERLGLEARSEFIDVPSVSGRAHVLVAGDGPPVLMAIGAGVPAAMWAPLMVRLDAFTLYAVDMPGVGLTEPVSHSTAGMRPWAVRFLSDVLDGLGLERPGVVAHSMSGLWAAWLAIDRPSRVGALAFVGCPALVLGSSAPLPLRLMAKPVLASLMQRLQPPSPGQVDRFAAMAREDFSHLPELRDVLLACQQLPSYHRSLVSVLNAAIGIRGARPELALTAGQLGQIARPVRYVWGEEDPFGSPDLGRRAAEVTPGADLQVVPGGHAPWFSGADAVSRAASPFLRTHARQPAGRGHATGTTTA